MCDTVVVTGEATKDGVTLFGKNSDREPNEAHHILQIPAADHPAGSRVKCTYIEIPQAEHTHAVLLAKPFWIWGAEMGANEHGLVIGNEAVFTKAPYDKKPSLIGMDFLRLALERATGSRQAVDVITTLLEEFGQGGNCGFEHKLYYHNSFLIADSIEAWVLETAGRHWAAKQVKGIYTISNRLSIENDWDLASADLITFAIEKGWCKNRDDFSFARCYSDYLYTKFSDSGRRASCSGTFLSARWKEGIDVKTVMSALRDHGDFSDPGEGITGSSVCMHAGFGPVRGSQTTGSMVSHLHPERATHFITGTAAPCTGIFKPVWTDTPFPETKVIPAGTYDESSLFWKHEAIHRAVLRDFRHRSELIAGDRDRFENDFIEKALKSAKDNVDRRAELANRCYDEAVSYEATWLRKVISSTTKTRLNFLYRKAWKQFNRKAKMRVEGF
ncbi:MAG: C69 family dipeptidase [Calditrichaceae bacterium]